MLNVLRNLSSSTLVDDPSELFQELFGCVPNLSRFLRNKGFLNKPYYRLESYFRDVFNIPDNERSNEVDAIINSIKQYRNIEAHLAGRSENAESQRITKHSFPMPCFVGQAESDQSAAIAFFLHCMCRKTQHAMMNVVSLLPAERQLICLKVTWLLCIIHRTKEIENTRDQLFYRYYQAGLKEDVITDLLSWTIDKVNGNDELEEVSDSDGNEILMNNSEEVRFQGDILERIENALVDVDSRARSLLRPQLNQLRNIRNRIINAAPQLPPQLQDNSQLRIIHEINNVAPEHLFLGVYPINAREIRDYRTFVELHPLLAYAIYYAGEFKSEFRNDRENFSRLYVSYSNLIIPGAAPPCSGLRMDNKMECVVNRAIRVLSRDELPVSTQDARRKAISIATLFEGMVPDDLNLVLNMSDSITALLSVGSPPTPAIVDDDDNDCSICMNDKIAACFGCGHSYCLICCLKMSNDGCPVRCSDPTEIIYIIHP